MCQDSSESKSATMATTSSIVKSALEEMGALVATYAVSPPLHVVFYAFDDYDEHAVFVCHLRQTLGRIEGRHHVESGWFPLSSKEAVHMYTRATIPSLVRTVCVLGVGSSFVPSVVLSKDDEAKVIEMGPRTIGEHLFHSMQRMDPVSAGELAWGLLS